MSRLKPPRHYGADWIAVQRAEKAEATAAGDWLVQFCDAHLGERIAAAVGCASSLPAEDWTPPPDPAIGLDQLRDLIATKQTDTVAALDALLDDVVTVARKLFELGDAIVFGSNAARQRFNSIALVGMEAGKIPMLAPSGADQGRHRAGKLPTPTQVKAYRVVPDIVPRLLNRIEKPRRRRTERLTDPDLQWYLLLSFAGGADASTVARLIERKIRGRKYSAQHLRRVRRSVLKALADEISK